MPLNPVSATVTTDASYNSSLFVAGVAGAIEVFDLSGQLVTSSMHQGAAPEVVNANDAELIAIECAIHQLSELVKKTQRKITHITFNTDSRISIENITSLKETGQCDKRYKKNAGAVLNALKHFPYEVSFSFKKIKAHVNNHNATREERLHNMVDEKSRAARHLYENHLFKPATRQDRGALRYVSVLAPSFVKPEDVEQFYSIGVSLSSCEQKVRLLFDTPVASSVLSQHPLLLGLAHGAEKRGESLNNVLADLQQDNLSMATYHARADVTLLRKHFQTTTSVLLAGEVSQLRLRNPERIKGLHNSLDIHKAVRNMTLKISLDEVERFFNALKYGQGGQSKQVKNLQHAITSLREKGSTHFYITPSQCNYFSYLQSRHLNRPILDLPKTFSHTHNEQQEYYFDFSTIKDEMLPESVLGYLSMKLKGEKIDPYTYKDPLQSLQHVMTLQSKDYQNAFLVQKLLHGPSTHSRVNIINPLGRAESPSSRIYNLCGKGQSVHSLSYWLDTLSSYINIPYTRGLDAVTLSMQQEFPTLTNVTPMTKAIMEYLEGHIGFLEGQQIRRNIERLTNSTEGVHGRPVSVTVMEHFNDSLLYDLKNTAEVIRQDSSSEEDKRQFTHDLFSVVSRFESHVQELSHQYNDIESNPIKLPPKRHFEDPERSQKPSLSVK